MELPANWPVALGIIVILIALAFMSGKIDAKGAIVGGLICLSITLGSGLKYIAFLAFFFLVGTLASQWKMDVKLRLGLAQDNEGKRTVVHAWSNGGVAGILAAINWLLTGHDMLLTGMMISSIAAATADTLSSEFGNVHGTKYYNILSGKPGVCGRDGVISMEGLIFGLTGSFLCGFLYGILVDWNIMILLISVSGFIGTLVDSVLGASLQRKGFIDNHQVNFLMTLAGALCFGGLYLLFS